MHARLSKSRVMSSLQCLRRVFLEVNRRDLIHFSAATETAFAVGHEVGAMAVQLYGGDNGTYIDYDGGSFTAALARTRELLARGERGPLFEATLEHGGVLVREDVLLPVDDGGRPSWRLVEIKASTRLKPEHVSDCAIQTWVHLESGYPLKRVSLAHIDSRFVYAGDGDYRGLFVEHDLTDRVFALLPEVPRWVERARDAITGAKPAVAVGQHCTTPNECPFIGCCWPGDSRYPITGLGGSRKKLGQWVEAGYRDIRDVPEGAIRNETQQRIHRVTRADKPELLPGARQFVTSLPHPRFYLDFETASPAVPLWAGTRPYQVLPFQWSCHIECSSAEIRHREFLDLSGEPPMRALALELIETLDKDGPVLMYTTYERTVIEGLIGLCPDLADALQAIIGRLVDLYPITKASYYHPDMLGSWSIKAVLPTIAPEMDYARLEGVHEGTEAANAYLEAIRPQTAQDKREQIRGELLRYCKHDTEAMLRLVRFFSEASLT